MWCLVCTTDTKGSLLWSQQYRVWPPVCIENEDLWLWEKSTPPSRGSKQPPALPTGKRQGSKEIRGALLIKLTDPLTSRSCPQLLSQELASSKQEREVRVQLLEERLRDMGLRVDGYEKLEKELDDVVMQAAESMCVVFYNRHRDHYRNSGQWSRCWEGSTILWVWYLHS